MAEEPYELTFLRGAAKQLSRLSKPIRENVGRHIDALTTNPRPQMTKKLRGQTSLWRLRVGDYRVLYEIDDTFRRVIVSEIGHRRDIYRGL